MLSRSQKEGEDTALTRFVELLSSVQGLSESGRETALVNFNRVRKGEATLDGIRFAIRPACGENTAAVLEVFDAVLGVKDGTERHPETVASSSAVSFVLCCVIRSK